jgi:uncharacterized RDD family membrane protein YckC
VSDDPLHCTKCGAPLAEGQRVCASCGEPVRPDPGSLEVPARPATAAVLYAGFWRRFVAYMIDSIVLSPVIAIVILRPLIARGTVTPDDPVAFLEGSTQQIMAAKLLITMVSWVYFAALESSVWQATLGKKILGLYVTDLNGRRISFARASGRYFAKIISGMILLLGFVMAGFTAKKQALHDFLAGCLVLRGRR